MQLTNPSFGQWRAADVPDGHDGRDYCAGWAVQFADPADSGPIDVAPLKSDGTGVRIHVPVSVRWLRLCQPVEVRSSDPLRITLEAERTVPPAARLRLDWVALLERDQRGKWVFARRLKSFEQAAQVWTSTSFVAATEGLRPRPYLFALQFVGAGEIGLERCEVTPATSPGEAGHADRPRRRLRRSAGPPDVIFMWKQNDHDVYDRRPGALARHLLAAGKVRRVLHLDSAISTRELERYVAEGQGNRIDDRRYIVLDTIRRSLEIADDTSEFRRTFVYRPGVAREQLLGREIPELDRYGEFVIEQMAALELARHPVLVVSPVVRHYEMVRDAVEPSMIVADLIDDQRAFPGLKPERRAQLDTAYRQIVSEADVITANCAPLVERFADLRDDIRLVPNGTEAYGDRGSWETPDELRVLPRPIIGYVGNLRVRLDHPLIRKVAQQHRNASIVLLGAGDGDLSRREFGSEPNVHLLGPRRHAQVVRYVRAFDLAIVPHMVDELTQAMNPVKLYMLVALGVPVLSTAVANVDELAEAISVAGSHQEFLDLVAAHLAGRVPPVPSGRRAALVSEVSWEARANAVWSWISE